METKSFGEDPISQKLARATPKLEERQQTDRECRECKREREGGGIMRERDGDREG